MWRRNGASLKTADLIAGRPVKSALKLVKFEGRLIICSLQKTDDQNLSVSAVSDSQILRRRQITVLYLAAFAAALLVDTIPVLRLPHGLSSRS